MEGQAIRRRNGPREIARCPRRTFAEAIEDAARTRWAGCRSLARNLAQVRQAATLLTRHRGAEGPDEVTAGDLQFVRAKTLAQGRSEATARCRLNCLYAIGVTARLPRVRTAKVRKWYLKEADEAALETCPGLHPYALAFIRWTCATGLRVEESLRLTWQDIDVQAQEDDNTRTLIHVPGTKTEGSDAVLPLSAEAVAVLATIMTFPKDLSAFGLNGWRPASDTRRVFRFSYGFIHGQWQTARHHLGYDAVPTATLKALRRSFARRATLNGMPPSVLQQYLRHESILTTQGYLALVGGYSHEEMGRWLR